MKNVISSLLLAFLLIFSAQRGNAAEAVIISITGTAIISHAGKHDAATVGKTLQMGDSLSVKSGILSLLTATGKLNTITAGNTFTLSKKQTSTGNTLTNRLITSLSEATTTYEEPTVKGMVRGEEELLPEFPHNSVILRKDLFFSWKSKQELENITVTVKRGNPLFSYFFEISGEENRAIYPEKAPELVDNARYYWKVAAYDLITGQPYETPLRWFSLLSENEEKQLLRDIKAVEEIEGISQEAKAAFLTGLYASKKLYQNARTRLEEQLKKTPESKDLQQLLETVNKRMGKEM